MHGAFFIEKLVGDKIDHLIHVFKAQKICDSKVANPQMPYQWIKYQERRLPKLTVNYHHEKNSDEAFSLPLVTELARKLGFWEIWIQKLVLHIVDDKWKDRLYYFKNNAVTSGSKVEAWIYNYLTKQYKQGLIEQVPLRHLALRNVSGLEPYYWQNNNFLHFLNRRTEGLVRPKEVKTLADKREVDVRILEKW